MRPPFQVGSGAVGLPTAPAALFLVAWLGGGQASDVCFDACMSVARAAAMMAVFSACGWWITMDNPRLPRVTSTRDGVRSGPLPLTAAHCMAGQPRSRVPSRRFSKAGKALSFVALVAALLLIEVGGAPTTRPASSQRANATQGRSGQDRRRNPGEQRGRLASHRPPELSRGTVSGRKSLSNTANATYIFLSPIDRRTMSLSRTVRWPVGDESTFRAFICALALAALWSVVCFAVPAGGARPGVVRARHARVPDPPSWGPEQELRNPFSRWIQHLTVWMIQAQDLDPAQQCAAIVGQLTGAAQELGSVSYTHLTLPTILRV